MESPNPVANRYGGDGRTTFALPNLKAQEPPNMRYCIALEGEYPSRN
jgi:microcystin-dependent protein